MSCYVLVTNRLFLGYTGKVGIKKGKWKYSKGIFKIVNEMEMTKLRITFCHFALCFILLKDFYTLICLDDFQWICV